MDTRDQINETVLNIYETLTKRISDPEDDFSKGYSWYCGRDRMTMDLKDLVKGNARFFQEELDENEGHFMKRDFDNICYVLGRGFLAGLVGDSVITHLACLLEREDREIDELYDKRLKEKREAENDKCSD